MKPLETLVKFLQALQKETTAITLEDKEVTEAGVQTFWRDLHGIAQIHGQEVNKLALLYEDVSPKSENDVESLCKCVQKSSCTFLQIVTTLSSASGSTFVETVRSCVGEVLAATVAFAEILLNDPANREEVLQNVGSVWAKCDAVQNLPRNNAKIASLKISEQKNLVNDALGELEEAKNNQSGNCDFEDDDEDELFGQPNWNCHELSVLLPGMGILKVAQALLKRISSNIAKNGDSTSRKSNSEIDSCLDFSVKISPAIDDFALTLYPPMEAEEVDKQSKIALEVINDTIKMLKGAHFVPDKEYEEWADFLVKAVDHNSKKLDVALTALKMNSVSLSEN